MVDRISFEACLLHLRHELDDYGVRGKDESRTWDELVDRYDVALDEAARAAGIDVPGPSPSIGCRFTSDAREWLEAVLTARASAFAEWPMAGLHCTSCPVTTTEALSSLER
jgi:hypothetical protein